MHEKSKYFNRRPAYILLKNGMRFDGYSFGAPVDNDGELVFQTGTTGYVESLTDPSYMYQIMVLTYPLIGNCGVSTPGRDEFNLITYHESERIVCAGLVVGEYSEECNHWNSMKPLSEWLVEWNIPAICGIDTRSLTKYLSKNGSQLAKIICNDMITNFREQEFFNPNLINLNDLVTVKTPQIINPNGKYKIAALDFGIKCNQMRLLSQLGARIHLLPWDSDFDINDYDGLFLSNGPGDPAQCVAAKFNVRKWINSDIVKPVFGICYGHQVLGLAAGFRTYKMKYGNRGLSVPCRLYGTKRCFMTTQNHGFAVGYNDEIKKEDLNSLDEKWDILFLNENDGSNEGIIHKTLPYYSVQFHPEHMAGPKDVEFLFKFFIEAVAAKLENREYHLKSELYKSALAFNDNAVQPECFRPRKLLLIGSGPLRIGQAAEFDYNGSQAIKAFKQENVYVVLINPNSATYQTSIDLADKVYFLPITAEYVTQVIKAERPDAISFSFGGSTSVNCGLELSKTGILAEYNVKVLGTTVETVSLTEDRDAFAREICSIGEKVVPSEVVSSLEEAIEAAERIGYPVLVRTSIGSVGSGFANNQQDMLVLAKDGFTIVDEVLLSKSLKGWKEIQFEVLRDNQDNCVTVCSMENVDPLGVHVGESIVCVPCQTLSNEEFYMLRSAALKVIRRLGIVGACQIQYALNPNGLDYYIIEVDAFSSRSAALASKATGYPLVYMSAKLSLGLSLVELKNSVTDSTTACFEPALDYCVVKMPRWDLQKFKRVSTKLGTSMKSIGEVMAIGRDFEEAFQKALRMIDDTHTGFDPYDHAEYISFSKDQFERELQEATDERIFVLASAIKSGLFTVDHLFELTGIDKWFLYKFVNIIEHIDILENSYRLGTAENDGDDDSVQSYVLDKKILDACKRLGFSDKQIAKYVNSTELDIRQLRKQFNIVPYIKQMDTISAEYPAHTNYLYVTYNGDSCDLQRADGFDDGQSQNVIVVGSGVFRIGSSIEYDWCSVSCLSELKRLGYKTIMINYNPSTVSTDYDMSDKLYFEELSFETVMNIYEFENPKGVILSMGGQVANNMAMSLYNTHKVKVLGTSPLSIDNSENRFKFSSLLDSIGIVQPAWRQLNDLKSSVEFCEKIGYPCIVRQSYGSSSMRVVYTNGELVSYIQNGLISGVSREHPIVITKFINDAKEIDVACVAKDGMIVAMAISSQIENAGIHSGDSTFITPPVDLNDKTIDSISGISGAIASALQFNGPFNLHVIAKDDQIYVLECNPRCARSFPFVSKTLEVDLVALSTQVALGVQPKQYGYLSDVVDGRIGVRMPITSFQSLDGADSLLGVDMVSTGEVACFGETLYEAYLKAFLSVGFKMPKHNVYVSIGSYKGKAKLLDAIRIFHKAGINLYGSPSTADYYSEHGITMQVVAMNHDETASGDERSIRQFFIDGNFDLVINMPIESSSSLHATSFINEGYHLRRMAINHGVPLLTNYKSVRLLAAALHACHFKEPLINTSLDCLTSVQWVKLPALIEVHVALQDIKQSDNINDITCGTKMALAGGYTQILITQQQQQPVVDMNQLQAVDQIYAQRSYCDYGLYASASRSYLASPHDLEQHTLGLSIDQSESNTLSDLVGHFASWPADGLIVSNAECTSLAAVLLLAELYTRRVHITRVSTKDDIQLIKLAKQRGLRVTCDVAPHHLFLSADGANNGSLNLKSESDRLCLWDHMDYIDVISSCYSYTLEMTLTLMLTAYKQGKISMKAIVEKLHDNPKKIFNLPEQADTFIEAEIDFAWTIPDKMPFGGATPFAGMQVYGKIHRVTLHGEVAYVDGNILAKPGSGRNLAVHKQAVIKTAPLSNNNNSAKSYAPALDSNKLQVPKIAVNALERDLSPSMSNLSMIGGQTVLERLTHASVFGLYQHNLIDIGPLNDHHKLHDIFNLAHNMRMTMLASKDLTGHLKGKILAEVFYDESPRTQYSFAAAMQRLGGSVITLNQYEKENLTDTVRMMSSYSDCLIFKHSDKNAIQMAVDNSNVPIVNAGDENPTQALVDLFTIREEIGHISGMTITLVGDLKNTLSVHALAKLIGQYSDVTVQYVAPDALKMPQAIRDYLQDRCQQIECKTVEEAIVSTDVLYMTGLGRKMFSSSNEYRQYQLTAKQMRLAKDTMIVMHSMPRGDEINIKIDTDNRAAYLRQAAYSLDVRMALLFSILKDH